MEISENEDNKKANPVNNPPPLPTTEELCTYVHCVHNMYLRAHFNRNRF